MASNVLNTVQLVERLTASLEKHISLLEKASKAGADYTNSIKVPSTYLSSQKSIEANQEKIIENNKELAKTEKQLLSERKKRETQVKKESDLRQRLLAQRKREETQNKREIALSTKLASSWNQLNVKLQQAELRYRNLAASQGKSNVQTKKAQVEVLKLRKQVDAINKPIKRWNNNVGNYASSLRGLAGALGWAGLTFAIINGIKATFESIKAYDALTKSLQKVTVSQQEATAQFAFVIDISERFGLSLRNTTSDYVKFLASVKGTNLEGKKARDIFESVSKSAASMGLSAEETSGTLRALNQIISKGKVQAEELRGQLGDRIPGALQIMARSLNVTTAELDKMLEQGQLIADEVLPAFAKEMERTFGVENVDRIDTLVAAQNRFSTAWDKMILSIENGDGVISNFIKNTFNAFSENLNDLTNLINGVDGALLDIQNENYLNFTDKLQEKNSKNIEGLRKLRDSRVDELNILNKRRAFIKTQIKFGDIEQEQGDAKLDTLSRLIAAEKGRVNAYRDYILNLAKANKLEEEDAKQGIAKVTSLNNSVEAVSAFNVEVTKMIKRLKEERSVLSKNSDAYKEKTDRIKIYQDSLDGVITTQNLLLDPKFKKIIGDAQDTLDNAEAMRILRAETDKYIDSFSSGFLGSVGLGSLDQFFDGTFDSLLDGLDSIEDKGERTAKKFAVHFNAIAEVAKEAFSFISQASQQNFDAEFTRLEQQRDLSLQFAGESATAREEIERQYEDRRAAIQTRQAKAEKKQALFKVAIDTAQAIVSSIAKSPETFGLPFSAFAAAAGLAQAAIINSQQIPQFWEGGTVDKGGTIMVNDDPYGQKGSNYKEVVETPKGQLLFPQGKNVKMDVPKGSKVHANYTDFLKDMNNNLFNPNDIAPFDIGGNVIPMIQNNVTNIDELKSTFRSEIGRLNSTIKNKKSFSFEFKDGEFKKTVMDGHTKKEILNARVTGRGLDV